jgi:hypothetical protein
MSVQAQTLRDKDVEELLFNAREKNKRLAITGVLLLIQGKFIQYIEGYEEDIDNVYRSIEVDPRHNDLLLLDSGYIDKRQYKNWTMAYRKVNNSEIKNILGYSELNLDDLFLNPAEEKTHPVLKVLYNFTHSLSA